MKQVIFILLLVGLAYLGNVVELRIVTLEDTLLFSMRAVCPAFCLTFCFFILQ